MRYQLTLITFAAAILSSVIISAPASAAALPSGTVACNVGTPETLYVDVGGTTVSSISAAAGDTMMITNTSGATLSIGTLGVANPGGGTIADMQSRTFTVVGFPGTVTFTPTGAGTNCTSASAITLTFTGSGGGSSSDSASSSSSTPNPIFQQFGKPSFSTCDAVAPESLNWSGVESGGWGESWAEWMNVGNGGAVCTRTLVYSTVQSRWVVG